MGALQKILFEQVEANKPAHIEAYVSFAKKYHMIMEKNLENHGGKFAAGNQVTIADFVMASYIGNCVLNPAFPLYA